MSKNSRVLVKHTSNELKVVIFCLNQYETENYCHTFLWLFWCKKCFKNDLKAAYSTIHVKIQMLRNSMKFHQNIRICFVRLAWVTRSWRTAIQTASCFLKRALLFWRRLTAAIELRPTAFVESSSKLQRRDLTSKIQVWTSVLQPRIREVPQDYCPVSPKDLSFQEFQPQILLSWTRFIPVELSQLPVQTQNRQLDRIQQSPQRGRLRNHLVTVSTIISTADHGLKPESARKIQLIWISTVKKRAENAQAVEVVGAVPIIRETVPPGLQVVTVIVEAMQLTWKRTAKSHVAFAVVVVEEIAWTLTSSVHPGPDLVSTYSEF